MSTSCMSAKWDLFRVWIASYEDWQPCQWHDVPPLAVAMTPAESGCFTRDEAAAYVEGFNAGEHPQGLWAVAVPVAVHYDGDPHTGDRIVPQPPPAGR